MSGRRVLIALALVLGLAAGGAAWTGYPFGSAIEAPAALSAGDATRQDAIVLLTGDSGTRFGMAPQIARRFRAEGVPVVLVNSLAFFSRRRTSADVALLLHDAIVAARSRYRARRIEIVGQSFGADVLPLGLEELGPRDRQVIAGVVLIVPSTKAYLRATPLELFNRDGPHVGILSAARTLDWARLTCIRGMAEEDSLCPSLAVSAARQLALPGGHHLNFEVDALFLALRPIVAADLAASSPAAHAPASAGPASETMAPARENGCSKCLPQ